MSVNRKRTIYIIMLLVLTAILIKVCRVKISRPYIARSHIARWFHGVARKYVEKGYKDGRFSDLCISNITSLSQLIPFREDKIPDNIRIPVEDYYKLGFTNQSIYTISSVTPSGKLLEFNQNYLENENKRYFWLYHHSSDMRSQVFFIEWSPLVITDNRLSWYYQCLIEDLTKEELQKEEDYRRKRGLPLLEFTVGNNLQWIMPD